MTGTATLRLSTGDVNAILRILHDLARDGDAEAIKLYSRFAASIR
jgi:hypothetical protein